MLFLRATIGIIVVFGLAILLGCTKHARHPATHFYLWLIAITVLLLLRFCL